MSPQAVACGCGGKRLVSTVRLGPDPSPEADTAAARRTALSTSRKYRVTCIVASAKCISHTAFYVQDVPQRGLLWLISRDTRLRGQVCLDGPTSLPEARSVLLESLLAFDTSLELLNADWLARLGMRRKWRCRLVHLHAVAGTPAPCGAQLSHEAARSLGRVILNSFILKHFTHPSSSSYTLAATSNLGDCQTMQPAIGRLIGSTHESGLDRQRTNTLGPLEARWTDYLCERQQSILLSWLETADPGWALFCGGPPRCGKVSQG